MSAISSPRGRAGLRYPSGLAIGPDGDLYVSSRDTDAVFQYDGQTGAYVRQLVLPVLGGLSRPYGLAFGPDGNLYVANDGLDAVLRFDGATGASRGYLVVSAGSGGLTAPRGLAFKPDGNLLVASSGTGEILEYDRWTGEFVRVFNEAYATIGTDISAWGLAIGPNGNVYVTMHEADGRVLELDVRDGTFLNSFVRGPTAALIEPTGMAFAPGLYTDCNQNGRPDNCDIADGLALDTNSNGVPDSCEVDCDGNGIWDTTEIIPAGPRYDCNYNGVIDECDLANGFDTDCNTNGVPDECEERAGHPRRLRPHLCHPRRHGRRRRLRSRRSPVFHHLLRAGPLIRSGVHLCGCRHQRRPDRPVGLEHHRKRHRRARSPLNRSELTAES